MTTNAQDTQPQEEKVSDKEMNFRKLEQKYEQERQARLAAEEKAAAIERAAQDKLKTTAPAVDDDDDSEPYVDKKKLKKVINNFGEQVKQQTKQEIEEAVQKALDGERRANYLKENNDFNNVMTPETIQKFADKHPRLAENILRMPDGFERQKLVYENIKALGIDKPEVKQSSIQDKVDANRRTPYYQPSTVGTAPYAPQGDYSPSGQKNSYEKMMELKKRMRI